MDELLCQKGPKVASLVSQHFKWKKVKNCVVCIAFKHHEMIYGPGISSCKTTGWKSGNLFLFKDIQLGGQFQKPRKTSPPPKTNIPCHTLSKMLVGRLCSFSNGPFSGDMYFRTINHIISKISK